MGVEYSYEPQPPVVRAVRVEKKELTKTPPSFDTRRRRPVSLNPGFANYGVAAKDLIALYMPYSNFAPSNRRSRDPVQRLRAATPSKEPSKASTFFDSVAGVQVRFDVDQSLGLQLDLSQQPVFSLQYANAPVAAEASFKNLQKVVGAVGLQKFVEVSGRRILVGGCVNGSVDDWTKAKTSAAGSVSLFAADQLLEVGASVNAQKNINVWGIAKLANTVHLGACSSDHKTAKPMFLLSVRNPPLARSDNFPGTELALKLSAAPEGGHFVDISFFNRLPFSRTCYDISAPSNVKKIVNYLDIALRAKKTIRESDSADAAGQEFSPDSLQFAAQWQINKTNMLKVSCKSSQALKACYVFKFGDYALMTLGGQYRPTTDTFLPYFFLSCETSRRAGALRFFRPSREQLGSQADYKLSDDEPTTEAEWYPPNSDDDRVPSLPRGDPAAQHFDEW
eukprot:gnl/Spiro4/142_TR78_c0_g1_i1.p1 gnl/Spiro4/142_TR78_c0_g1~~gnl/Spiro4/142_TR78_c0_g1_i1.p1  ORF type:complete len:464 (+),score=129.25 gnl/Spiro4/142_TR78_c0_g1_i1:43-1392(+)